VGEARTQQLMAPLPSNLHLKNMTALELNKFIGEKVRSHNQSALQHRRMMTLDASRDPEEL